MQPRVVEGSAREDTLVLGVSAYYHDSAAAIVRNGTVLAASHEERFSRRKNDPRFPSAAVAACLREAGATLADVPHVVYYEQPRLKLDRILHTLRAGREARPLAQHALPLWATRRDMEGRIRRQLGPGFAGAVHFTGHHLSHAASAFYPSPFRSAAVLVHDAVGEWATSSLAHGSGSQLDVRQEVRFPHSLGMLYSAFTAYCGFRVNSGEYKLMGLAPYGTPRYTETISRDVVAIHDDGSLTLNLDYFPYARGGPIRSESLDHLLGGPGRDPEGPILQRHLDVAASIQRVCETVVVTSARYAREVTGERNLAMAGGVALNCVANGRLADAALFDRVWVQPAAGDAGGALGAALAFWHRELGRPRTPEPADGQQGSLLGPSFTPDDVQLYLDGQGARYHTARDEEELIERVCDWLEQGLVIGWFQGRMEFGPRALGARSIIADPRRAEMQRTVNTKIKFRESFRPFAPSVLREYAHDPFEVPPGADLPYMTTTSRVRESQRVALDDEAVDRSHSPDLVTRVSVVRSTLPAVTHVDYSARLHTVDPERHGRFHRLLSRFHGRTGCPAVLNTSFNVRGEPIVHSPHDALGCFLTTDMDALVLQDCLLLKDQQPDALRVTVGHRPPTGAD
ncbi:carbamoyltransferase family protein [Ornithinicoccus halotolerans]|uniref:carbamoyltransferase family protein n=1 Tax=Ornithinicoccus halotolerans TaxID=1748220 RepID=UPI001E4591E5|nr:carbamoyltransferase N-terminal domain-containing protein [Ornithinicoccus halotolerans]